MPTSCDDPSTHVTTRLLWWKDLKGSGDLLLPAHLVLTEDLGADLEVLATLWEETGAEDDGVWAHNYDVVS